LQAAAAVTAAEAATVAITTSAIKPSTP